MENKKVTFIASECHPFFASGGLGDVIGSLPSRIISESKGEYDVTVILPLYANMTKIYRDRLEFVAHTTISLAWRCQYCGIFKYEAKGVKYYFLDNEYYFKRSNLYGYFDDGERFAFFCKAAIDVMEFLNEIPDIIHVHDWEAGMVPIYLRTNYYGLPKWSHVKTIFTIHNIEYQGKYSFDDDIIEDVFGISRNLASIFEYQGFINVMKGAMESSNYVSTVSPTYAEEIQEPEYAHGLDHEVRRVRREGKLFGILNGIDKNFYNPGKDNALFCNFDRRDYSNKSQNKLELQKMLGLPVDENIPLIGMVTRLVGHKGLDLVTSGISKLLEKNVQVVILGTGDSFYEGFFRDLETRYSHKMRVIIAYNADLSRKIYGASDIFLMPSKAEPCGLSQMISSRYGSIPVVRSTGGLRDSIKDFANNNGNGYVFEEYSSEKMLEAVYRALNDYEDKDAWQQKIGVVMNINFGWSASAKAYVDLYNKILSK